MGVAQSPSGSMRSLAVILLLTQTAHAEAPPVVLPAELTMDEALHIFRTRGLDLLIAEAAVLSAQGSLRSARQIQNPTWSYTYSHIFGYDPKAVCPDQPGNCSPDVHSITLGDNNAIEDVLSGKRGLRVSVAEKALEAARQTRVDAQRTLELQVKTLYIQAVQARDNLDFALEAQKAFNRTFDLVRLRYQAGAISEADEAKVETAKLEADQAVDVATQALRFA
jgi:cobalt-zinc-cadmium efflux system outer membrane protein